MIKQKKKKQPRHYLLVGYQIMIRKSEDFTRMLGWQMFQHESRLKIVKQCAVQFSYLELGIEFFGCIFKEN